MRLHLGVSLVAALLLVSCGSQAQTVAVIQLTPAPTKAPTASSALSESIKVYVAGAVHSPGVYTLGPDSRVEDAINAAGGFVDGADMARVNLAARVRDEEEIFVPKVGEAGLPSSAGASGPVNLNTASSTQLRDALGISSSLASKIVSYRNKNGPFATVDDLKRVPVPSADFNRIRDAVSTQ